MTEATSDCYFHNLDNMMDLVLGLFHVHVNIIGKHTYEELKLSIPFNILKYIYQYFGFSTFFNILNYMPF